MNREAITHLLSAREDGASSAELADLYESLTAQIISAERGAWRAIRGECIDGSHLFRGAGAGAPVLVITPECAIMIGSIYPGELIDPLNMTFDSGRGWLFPPPNPSAEGTRVL